MLLFKAPLDKLRFTHYQVLSHKLARFKSEMERSPSTFQILYTQFH